MVEVVQIGDRRVGGTDDVVASVIPLVALQAQAVGGRFGDLPQTCGPAGRQCQGVIGTLDKGEQRQFRGKIAFHQAAGYVRQVERSLADAVCQGVAVLAVVAQGRVYRRLVVGLSGKGCAFAQCCPGVETGCAARSASCRRRQAGEQAGRKVGELAVAVGRRDRQQGVRVFRAVDVRLGRRCQRQGASQQQAAGKARRSGPGLHRGCLRYASDGPGLRPPRMSPSGPLPPGYPTGVVPEF